MKVAFTTLGCRTNQHDTAEMQVLLEKEGYSIVNSSETADVYVINTCTVTARSDYSSRLAVKKSLAINENATVVFTGCYAQLNPENSINMEGLDIVLGNADKLKIAEVLKAKLKNNSLQKESGLAEIYMSDIHADREFQTLPVTQFQGRTKAFIKVQTGCDESCSFCTVVRARGSSASDTRENILDNVRHAIDGGYKEITLTGINLGTWGMDFHSKETFSSLVEDIANLNGNFRVRLSSINPMEIDDHLIELISQHEKICPHLHIPLQSGDTEVLSKMRRNYNAKQYEHIVRRASEKISPLGLGADVIVGFPGESEASFEHTRKLIEELPFSYLHVFSYSPRSGTEAHNFKNNIKNITKKERNLILSDLVKEKAQLFYKSFVGKKVTVLIEERKQADGVLKGHSEHYIPVRVDAEGFLQNQLVSVLITEIRKNELVGCLES
ncbi:MAG: tRNA (N(6)-L-threonylcarbamoyladenosine(37)-C(2))-methylthiotransferase MtaB [Nitrospinales bacterium]|nr:tRNA (N(6)-L-threonylcarbamoyladenosine(37)-C(2))-methylthiotransferase MtaB [Nitrospinales bacterium]